MKKKKRFWVSFSFQWVGDTENLESEVNKGELTHPLGCLWMWSSALRGTEDVQLKPKNCIKKMLENTPLKKKTKQH